MASHWFNEGLLRVMNGDVDLVGDDIRVVLCMTDCTVDSENDGIAVVSDLSDLDECDGANYVRKALSNEAASKDDGNDRAEFTSDPVTWTSLGVGTRSTKGALFYKHVTNDGDSIPLFWQEYSSPIAHNGTDFIHTPHADGLAQIRVGT